MGDAQNGFLIDKKKSCAGKFYHAYDGTTWRTFKTITLSVMSFLMRLINCVKCKPFVPMVVSNYMKKQYIFNS